MTEPEITGPRRVAWPRPGAGKAEGRAMLAKAARGEHDITPVKGSARQLDGTPADLLAPRSYPVEALCIECGQPVRCERLFLCEWVHIPRFTMTGAA